MSFKSFGRYINKIAKKLFEIENELCRDKFYKSKLITKLGKEENLKCRIGKKLGN